MALRFGGEIIIELDFIKFPNKYFFNYLKGSHSATRKLFKGF